MKNTFTSLSSESPHPNQQPSNSQRQPQLSPMSLNQLETIRLETCKDNWKKQLQMFVESWGKRQTGQWPKFLKKELIGVIQLLGGEGLSCSKPENRSFRQQSTSIITVNKLTKSKQAGVILLFFRKNSSNSREFWFELTVLGLQGFVLYNSIYLKNWEELRKDLHWLQQRLTLSIILIHQKNQLISLISPKSAMLLQSITAQEDLEEFLQRKTGEPNLNQLGGRLSYQDSLTLQNQVRQRLKMYVFCRRSIQRNEVQSQRKNPLKYWQYWALTYNLAFPQISSFSQNFNLQLQQVLPTIRNLIQQIVDHHTTKKDSSDHHYPVPLTNVHFCWNCKGRKGNVACSGCSVAEGKTVPLCLDCYSSYHKEAVKSMGTDQVSERVKKWEECSLQMDVFMNSRMVARQMALNVCLKKEESE